MSAEEVTMIPNTKEWLEARKNYMGASDAPAALGMSSWVSPYGIWCSKQPDTVVDTNQTPQQRRGHVLENAVALAYADIMGVILQPSQHVVHPDHEWMACTPDRFISGELRHIQIKTHSSWVKEDYGDSGSSDYPLAEFVQVQHELAVTGNESADLVVLLADDDVMSLMVKMLDDGAVTDEVIASYIRQMDLRIFPINADRDYIDTLIKAEADFWKNYVKAGIAPPDITQEKPGSKDCREATAAEAKDMEVAKKHWLALERATERLEKKKQRLQEIIGCGYGLMHPETKEKITWGYTEKAESHSTDWKAVVDSLSADGAIIPEALESAISAHTTVKPASGFRVFRWPTAKWKKEM